MSNTDKEYWRTVARLLLQRLGGDVVITKEEVAKLTTTLGNGDGIIMVTEEAEGTRCKLLTSWQAKKFIKENKGR